MPGYPPNSRSFRLIALFWKFRKRFKVPSTVQHLNRSEALRFDAILTLKVCPLNFELFVLNGNILIRPCNLHFCLFYGHFGRAKLWSSECFFLSSIQNFLGYSPAQPLREAFFWQERLSRSSNEFGQGPLRHRSQWEDPSFQMTEWRIGCCILADWVRSLSRPPAAGSSRHNGLLVWRFGESTKWLEL